jgi:hypothetical protein
MMSQPILKEFLYVDVDRTRSLLAQLQGGIIDAITSESAKTVSAGASASFFGIGGKGEYGHEARHHESRSFQEMIFAAFETLADEHDFVTDLGDEVRDPARWRSGEVHADLKEGLIVRLACDVQVLDGKLFGERLSRFDKMAEGILRLNHQPTPKHSKPADRQRLLTAAKTVLMGGMTSDQLAAMGDFVDAFVGEGIALRALPCGLEDLELGFGGALLGRREYIQEERETLFSRYGTVASNWTCVLQIAAIPMPVESPDDDQDEVNSGSDGPDVEADFAPEAIDEPSDDHEDGAAGNDADVLTEDGEGISRARMEGIAVELLAMMEKVGVVDGPRWPTISVTPLAVYRTVPRS